MRFIVTGICVLSLAGCSASDTPAPPPRDARELVIMTVASPVTFYQDSQGRYAGLEHDLAHLFAQELKLRPSFVLAQEAAQVLPALAKGKGHFAAAGLAVDSISAPGIRFGPAYQTVQPVLVYNTANGRPFRPTDLVGGRLEVTVGMGIENALGELRKQAPNLRWRTAPGLDADDLLAKVADAAIEFTVVNSNQFEVARNFYPNLGAAFHVGPPVQIAWAFPKDTPPLLLDQAREFFERIRANGLLQRLIDRYYGHVKRLSTNDLERFLEKTESVLPKYRALFQRAEELTGIDWRLLAALGYQESQWNPLATSPTNVRGLMMLTEDTADRLRVSNRLDARQSILAGSRYLQELRNQLPESIEEPDRTWLALAAYNLGFGHLQGGRALAKMRKLNPDSWLDMKKMLPLLSRPEYAARLKSGAARGGEAVIMTENIRTYYDILVRHEPAYKPVFPPLGASAGNVSALEAD